jgi:molybdenum cofactor cytidylyltransferase
MIVAIVPAAGLSVRMGRPKPLLDVAGRPLLVRVVESLLAGGSGAVVVVGPPRDRPETAELVWLAERAGAEVVIPDDQPIDMRSSIELGLTRAEALGPPSAILLSPADVPGIRLDLVRQVIRAFLLDPEAIIVPTSPSGRGHPVCLPWEVATAIRTLPAGTGVNRLLDDPPRRVVEVASNDPLSDIDTPEDYRLWVSGQHP